MKKTGYHYGNGLAREEFEIDRATLEGFFPIDNDWKGLFRWVMACGENIEFYDKEGRIDGNVSDLWSNHVLTVLIEIAQKNIREYQDSFIEGRGTAEQSQYIDDIYNKFCGWIKRLDYYLSRQREKGYTDQAPDLQATLLLKQKLEESGLARKKPVVNRSETDDDKQVYYKMINCMKDISRECDRYLQMIGASGNMDGSLSLLFTYIRNYNHVIGLFNRMTQKLPDFYHEKVLQATPQKAIQDKTFLIIRPAKDITGFILPAGTAFPAGTNEDGTDLLYHTLQDEYITSMKLEAMHSVFLKKVNNNTTGVYKQPVELDSPSVSTSLFPDDCMCLNFSYGWMIESQMLVLDEGKRNVKIGFLLTGNNVSRLGKYEAFLIEKGFSVWLSDAEGWCRVKHNVDIETIDGDRRLVFSFTIEKNAAIPIACNREIHQTETQYPSVRLLIDNKSCPYDLATQIYFSEVLISVEVSDIRNFTFYNELGEIDTMQPFYPFGTKADQGAWFMFGNEEMGLKPLEEVCLEGEWKKLPPEGYTELFKSYPYESNSPITDESFHIQTEFQKDGRWHICDNSLRQLFQKVGMKLSETANIKFEFQNDNGLQTKSFEPSAKYEYSREHDGFFRVTLEAPSIGFGMTAYSELFTAVMIHNSRVKEKHQKVLPATPIIPMLADVALSYKASDKVKLTDLKNASIRLSHITSISEYDSFEIDECESQPLLPEVEDVHQLYWTFLNATKEKEIHIYMDLAFAESNLVSYNPEIVAAPVLLWEYQEGNKWCTLQPTAHFSDETNGFTQAGFINIEMPETINEVPDGKVRIRTRFQGDVSPCLAVRNVWLNCIQVTATASNGNPLPSCTIQKTLEENEFIESIDQPLDGFGGRAADTLSKISVRQSHRIAHRLRAVLPEDYESLLMEQFPEVEKANCISFPGNGHALEVKVVVFCRTDGFPYFITSAWKLSEMRKYLSAYTSPFVSLQVINPVYRPIDVFCKAILKSVQVDKEIVESQLIFIIRNYLAPWIRKNTFPQPGQIYSYRELHARMANHEYINKMEKLTIDGKSPQGKNEKEDFILTMDLPWIIPIPGKIVITLLPPTNGVDEGEIGKNFKIR